MIEINLIPDVKQEYLRAKRARTLVVSGAIIVGIASVAIVVLLAVYLFGVQTFLSKSADSAITNNQNKLTATADLSNMLTVQNQLESISSLHESEITSSRLFSVLTAINPASPNQVTYSTVKLDSSSNLIHIDGQAAGGFVAADVFKKTIEAVEFSYQNGDKTTSNPIASDISITNLSYGQDSGGAKVLRFSVDLTYDPALFAAKTGTVSIVRPDRQNATDSYKYLPLSLFGSRAADIGGAQ